MRNLIFLSLLLGLFSCNTHPFDEEIEQVDSLSVVLDSLNEKFITIDLEKTREIAKQSSDLQKYLSKNYPDTADREFWVNKMTPLYDVQRNLGKFLNGETEVKNELDYTIEQLKTLKNSLKDNKLTKEEAQKYLDQEAKAVAQISYFLNKYYPRINRSLRTWKDIHIEMQRIADSVKAL